MSTKEPTFGTTGERLRSFALSDDARERASALATRYWEIAAYGFLFISAAILRFYNLGARAMHHDESLHGFYGYAFTKGLRNVFTVGTDNWSSNYHHVPFMHGPFQFIGSGFMMWIFGDGEYQARILAATMGTGMVLMPWLLRKQLGTVGALAASAFIAFSPTLLYYSRFTREDIYAAFWTLGIVIFLWRYLASRDEKWLFLSAGFLAGLFCTKETSAFTAVAFLGFLDYLVAVHLADQIRAKDKSMSDVAYAAITIGMLFAAPFIILLWPLIASWREKYDLDKMPAAGIAFFVLGSLAAPQYAAFLQMGLGDSWQLRSGGADLHVAREERTVAYTSIILLIGASAVIGVLLRPRTWLIAAAAFWVPFVLLSTTFFTNFAGFMSVIWGSFDYWISQQDVARGNQPIYYYFVTIPVYEFVPLGVSIAAMLYYGIAGNVRRAAIVGGMALAVIFFLVLPPGPEILRAPLAHVWIPFTIVLIGVMALPMDHFNRFLIFWLVTMSFVLTVASEKMPWLNVHIALPLAILAGKFFGDMLQTLDVREDLPKFERFAPFLYASVAAALAIVVFTLVGPWQPASFGAWTLVAVAAISVYWAFTGYSRRTALQVAMVAAVVAFSVFTIRAGRLAAWGHPNNPFVGQPGDVATRDYGEVPTELLVYTQTSGDIPELRDRIAAYARETGLGYNQPIVVDDGKDSFTWPWAWYLRDYKSVAYAQYDANYEPAAGAILLVSQGNAANVNPLGYAPGIPYHHRRWFQEEYRGHGGDGTYTTHDFFGDIVSPHQWDFWIDFWVRRTHPAPAPGTVDGVAYFPGEGSLEPAAPTVRTEGTQIVIGGRGFAKGQLEGPSDVALDAEGNLYIADTVNDRIQKYAADGVFLAYAGGFGSDVKIEQPWSMTVADDGTVFVASTWDHTILKLDKDLKQVDQWGAGGQLKDGDTDPFKLFGPREITLAPNGNVLIADTGNSRVVEYTADGEFVRQFGSAGASGGPLEFSEPVGIEVNAAGDIYIGDFWNKRVVVLDKDLNLKTTIAVDAWGSDAVTDRGYMALLDDGRLLVTDPTNGKVLAFGLDGAPLASYDVPKEGDLTFARPIGIATDGTSVYVADSSGNVVRKIPLTEIIP